MTDDHRLEEEINRLYWGTDRSVADIAETVGASRRALYDAIHPRPAGATCPSCGGELTFRNRRSVQHREAECAGCGREQEVTPGAAAGDRDGGEATPPGSATRHQRRDPSAEAEAGRGATGDAGRSTLIGAAALIGLAIGAVAALLMRRR